MILTRIIPPTVLFSGSLVLALPAQAASLTRTFVSSSGNDTNPCTIAQPCATFLHAYSLTASGGIIAALDPGKYGPLKVTGPITINGNGWAALTTPSGGTGITVNAGPSDQVTLIGLEIDGGGVGTDGIQFVSAGSLTITNCILSNHAGHGIEFDSDTGAPETLAVSNSYFSNNGGSGIELLAESSGFITASIDRSGFFGNANGLGVGNTSEGGGAVSAAVVDSVLANSSLVGASVSGGATGVNLALTRVQVLGNTTGLKATDLGTISLTQSGVIGNATGFSIVRGGTVASYGDNTFLANGPNTGSLTPVTKQ